MPRNTARAPLRVGKSLQRLERISVIGCDGGLWVAEGKRKGIRELPKNNSQNSSLAGLAGEGRGGGAKYQKTPPPTLTLPRKGGGKNTSNREVISPLLLSGNHSYLETGSF